MVAGTNPFAKQILHGFVLVTMRVLNSYEVINKNPAYKKLENDAVSAINVFTGIQLSVDKEGGKVNMCKGWDDHKKSGMDLVNRLNVCLAADGRNEDIIKAANDPEYQNELIEYYGLDKKKEPVEV